MSRGLVCAPPPELLPCTRLTSNPRVSQSSCTRQNEASSVQLGLAGTPALWNEVGDAIQDMEWMSHHLAVQDLLGKFQSMEYRVKALNEGNVRLRDLDANGGKWNMLHERMGRAATSPPASVTYQGAVLAPSGLGSLGNADANHMEEDASTECGRTASESSTLSNEWDTAIAAASLVPKRTSMMIRNIPQEYQQDALVDEFGLLGVIDFLYLPRSSVNLLNLTYAFVNFKSVSAATKFQQQWQKRCLSMYSSRKPLNISHAEVQGFEANLKALQKKRSRCLDFRRCQPLIFLNGKKASLKQIQQLMPVSRRST